MQNRNAHIYNIYLFCDQHRKFWDDLLDIDYIWVFFFFCVCKGENAFLQILLPLAVKGRGPQWRTESV